MFKTLSYGRQSIDDNDEEAVLSVLRSGWLTQGPKIEEFERGVADYCGAKYAVAVSSGTAALHLACLALGLKEGDFLWTSPNSFVASANCAFYCGARPDFVDIDPITYNMDVDALEKKLIKRQRNGELPKVVIPVHFAGQSCDMEQIRVLSERYGFSVVEDACHAMGGKYRGYKIGSCKYSDMTVFSFHPVKTITTGEGGAVLTNDEELYNRLILLRTHGITRNGDLMDAPMEGPWFYQQIELGMNYRITDFQASLGLSQLSHIDRFVSHRKELAERYNDLLAALPLTIPQISHENDSAYHLYVVRLDFSQIKKIKKDIFNAVKDNNIILNVHYIPIHSQLYYRKSGFRVGQFPESEKYYNEAVTLPLYPDLTREEQDHVINTLKSIL